MAEITKRLQDATQACVTNYESWEKDKKDLGVRESLREAVHELRKAAARLEIEIATSERDQMKSKPLPIPPHRSSRPKGGKGNTAPGGNEGQESSGRGKGRGSRSSSSSEGGRGGRRRSSANKDS